MLLFQVVVSTFIMLIIVTYIKKILNYVIASIFILIFLKRLKFSTLILENVKF